MNLKLALLTPLLLFASSTPALSQYVYSQDYEYDYETCQQLPNYYIAGHLCYFRVGGNEEIYFEMGVRLKNVTIPADLPANSVYRSRVRHDPTMGRVVEKDFDFRRSEYSPSQMRDIYEKQVYTRTTQEQAAKSWTEKAFKDAVLQFRIFFLNLRPESRAKYLEETKQRLLMQGWTEQQAESVIGGIRG